MGNVYIAIGKNYIIDTKFNVAFNFVDFFNLIYYRNLGYCYMVNNIYNFILSGPQLNSNETLS